MKIHTRGLVACLFLIPVFASIPTASARDDEPGIRITQVDDSSFPQVSIYVSVTDASGEPLAVNPNQIQVFENGQLVQPDQISGSGPAGPLTTLLVMDVSGSMYNIGKLTAAKAAAQAYVEQMRPGDLAGLLTFNTRVTYVQAITGDRTSLIHAINSLDARGDTAMFDALDEAAGILQGAPGRKAIIILTDGLDNRSKHSYDEVIQAIGAGGLSISTIGLGDPDKLGINSGLDESILQSLAARAGGSYGYASDPTTLRGLYEKFGRALQSEYCFTYTTSSALRDGLSRNLAVSLGGSTSAQASYNPGGVLPEVDQPASWLVFIILLAILIGLFFIPSLAGRIRASVVATKKKETELQKPHIRFKE